MRIAVPIVDGLFSEHFGHSTGFWICDLQENPPSITNARELAMPDGGGCGVIPAVLAEAGVNTVIAGGIGTGTVQNLHRFGIQAVAGVAPASPQQLAMDFLAGHLATSGQLCAQHEAHGRGDHGQEAHGHHGHGEGGCQCHGAKG